MRCDEFENRLQELLDERQSLRGDEELRAHGEKCASCAKLLREYQSLFKAVDGMLLPALSEDFTSRVVAQASAISPTLAVRRSRPRRIVRLALAAALFVAAVPTLRWIAGVPQVVAPLNEQLAAQPTHAPAGSESLEGAGIPQRSMKSLQLRLSEMLDGVGAADSPGKTTFGPSEGLTSKFPTEIAPGVEPLGVTAGRSVVALFRVMPPSIAMADSAGADQ